MRYRETPRSLGFHKKIDDLQESSVQQIWQMKKNEWKNGSAHTVCHVNIRQDRKLADFPKCHFETAYFVCEGMRCVAIHCMQPANQYTATKNLAKRLSYCCHSPVMCCFGFAHIKIWNETKYKQIFVIDVDCIWEEFSWNDDVVIFSV